MESLEESTWHESHVVWHLPPSACVHITHGTWRMKSKYEESERKFPLVRVKKKKQFGGRKKRKRRKGEKGKENKRKKTKEKEERKEKEEKQKR